MLHEHEGYRDRELNGLVSVNYKVVSLVLCCENKIDIGLFKNT